MKAMKFQVKQSQLESKWHDMSYSNPLILKKKKKILLLVYDTHLRRSTYIWYYFASHAFHSVPLIIKKKKSSLPQRIHINLLYPKMSRKNNLKTYILLLYFKGGIYPMNRPHFDSYLQETTTRNIWIRNRKAHDYDLGILTLRKR